MNRAASLVAPHASNGRSSPRDEILLASRRLGENLFQIELSVPGAHCAGCMRTIETGLRAVAGVDHARVNLSTKRVSVRWRGEQPPALIEEMKGLGFQAHLVDTYVERKNPELGRLIRALAVAGFSAMNIMLLSVSVWSGADPETRQAFHWISAALALPCLIYSGRIFFVSAWRALRHGRTNMDVPISVGISLAFSLSLYDTAHGGPHAFFDAATSLVFFLLIGRTLDHMMREKTRSAVQGLARLSPRGATLLDDDGAKIYRPVSEIRPGMLVLLAAGDRVPVDGRVETGRSELECAIITGESSPQTVDEGAIVRAGALNLTGALTVIATARAEDSFLAEMIRLMEAAEGGRARYRRLADRAARLYSPAVHSIALATFIGWMIATGDWHSAITIAIAVLIITCPCALGLAVPIVQVMAARRLFENGIMMKDGGGIERLAEIDTVIFDKTGTLTSGATLIDAQSADPGILRVAAALGAHSHHPQAAALSASLGHAEPSLHFTNISEHPGFGIQGTLDDQVYRLGRADWALAADPAAGTVLGCAGRKLATFQFQEQLRQGARAAVGFLRAAGLEIHILSGDARAPVEAAAALAGIENYQHGALPRQKVSRLSDLAAHGRKVLMVGDGLNDGPALLAAHVSMAPGTAADISRNAADFVFLRDDLSAVPIAYRVAREAGKLVRQNFGLAIAYNALALPIAIMGYVTPLVAAVAMSTSSLLVVANALRLKAPIGEMRNDASAHAPRANAT